ncbi:MAG: cobalamin-dependent protein [Planctomycetia bacterium]|nr:cobalamin-dependent protein [Planctomycetia bacterium]
MHDLNRCFIESTEDIRKLPLHPKGTDARVLLTSVFGPYAVDDEYGSRRINPMELYHNQVTREQGVFSLRMFHRSWGIMFIQANISAPCTVLDFPSKDRFIEELKTVNYDVIGISSILPNVGKVREMCRLIRKYQPNAVIVLGGHIANAPECIENVSFDLLSRGEGVRWFREYLQDDMTRPLRHPSIVSGFGSRNVGMPLTERPGRVTATVIPSLGCPMGCNFCATSAMFGGKGKFVNFFESGEELFHIMCELERTIGAGAFFIMDENFLLHKKRALELLALMEEHDKAWVFYVFSSANALKQYTMDQLVRLGISWVWMGLEGKDSQYNKLHGTDAHQLVRELRENGVKILGSSIIGLETHTYENIQEVIEFAASYNTDFHQFMLYTPVPGTPLYRELRDTGKMKDRSEYDFADTHGQFQFNYRHPSIKNGDETEMLRSAFAYDFAQNGPSTARIVETTLNGYLNHRNHPSARVRRRFEIEAGPMLSAYIPLIAYTKKRFRKSNPRVSAWANSLLKRLFRTFGWKARVMAFIGSLYLAHTCKAEEKKMKDGWVYDPQTFYERNEAVRDENIQLAAVIEPLEKPKKMEETSIECLPILFHAVNEEARSAV